MTSQIKICGLTRAKDVQAAIRYGAEYLGFIVEAESKRRLSVNDAAKIALPAKGLSNCVAVTVNADDNLLTRIISEMQPDYIQCHGDETPERVANIAKIFQVKTIKAVPIRTDQDMIEAECYSGVANFILYDAKPPSKAAIRGGHGISFDWDILIRNPRPKLFALAGGLRPDNIKDAVIQTSAPILDISSGVEYAPGKKDPTKIKSIINRAKQAKKR